MKRNATDPSNAKPQTRLQPAAIILQNTNGGRQLWANKDLAKANFMVSV